MSTAPILVPVAALGAASEVAVGVEQGARYELVGPDGTRAVLNDRTDPDFVGWLTEPPTGLDSPEVRESADTLVEADGGVHGAFYFGRRPFTLTGIIDPTPDPAIDYVDVETVIATNLLANGSFEVDLAGWTSSNTPYNSATRDTSWVAPDTGGIAAARLIRSTAYTAGQQSDFYSPQIVYSDAGLAVGDTVTFSLYYRLVGATGTPYINPRISWLTSAGAFVAGLGVSINPAAAPGTQGRLTATGTIPPGTDRFIVDLLAGGAGGTVDWLVDGVYVVKDGPPPVPFNDTLPGPLGYPYRSRSATGGRSTLSRITRRTLEAGEVANKRINRLQRATRAMTGDAELRWQAANGPAVRIAGRRQQPLRITGRLPKAFMFAGVAAEPRILSQAAHVISGAGYASTDTTSSLTARNDGNAPSSPVTTVRATAAVTGPVRIINRATGQIVEVNVNLAVNDVLVVDHRARTILLNGANRYDALNFVASSWWDVQPGDNPVAVTVVAGAAAATFELAWRDAWL